MTNYLLIHGAWHGGWAWVQVAPTLRAQGHQVHAPTLPDAPSTTLADHVAAVRNAIDAMSGSVTVVAHSYAGVVVPQAVAMSDPARVEALVMVDGWLAAAGESLLDVAPEWFGDWCRSSVVDVEGGSVIAAPPASTLGLVDEDLVRLVESRMTAQPLRTFTDPATVTLDRPSLPRYALTCVPSMFPFGDLARASGYRVTEVESDHEVMLSRPEDFLRALASFTPDPPH